MTGQAGRSTKMKQALRCKARGWNSLKEQANVGTLEAEPSCTSWKTKALEAEPSWTPWQALATPWEMGQHAAKMNQHGRAFLSWGHLGANSDQLGPTWVNLRPTWTQLGPKLAPCWRPKSIKNRSWRPRPFQWNLQDRSNSYFIDLSSILDRYFSIDFGSHFWIHFRSILV